MLDKNHCRINTDGDHELGLFWEADDDDLTGSAPRMVTGNSRITATKAARVHHVRSRPEVRAAPRSAPVSSSTSIVRGVMIKTVAAELRGMMCLSIEQRRRVGAMDSKVALWNMKAARKGQASCKVANRQMRWALR
jgi:hypothetical protein